MDLLEQPTAGVQAGGGGTSYAVIVAVAVAVTFTRTVSSTLKNVKILDHSISEIASPENSH